MAFSLNLVLHTPVEVLPLAFMVLELKSSHFSHRKAADAGEWNHLVNPSQKWLHTFPLFVKSLSSPWVSKDYSADGELVSYCIGFEQEQSSS